MKFSKYQGTGNDFIMIDNRELFFNKNKVEIAALCHRRFGIGADGVILLQNVPNYDFEMVYYNADGSLGSMCGNGGRCAVRFAHHLGLFKRKTNFLAVDGAHQAELKKKEIRLKMKDVSHIEYNEESNFFFLDTGSPHYVEWVRDLGKYEVFSKGKAIRNNERFREKGTNVNFIEKTNEHLINIRTYERGVEDETLACGTGSVAAALVLSLKNDTKTAFTTGNFEIIVKTLGGHLAVSFTKTGEDIFENIYLSGAAEKVFEGEI